MTLSTSRTPWQGALNIVRFNWPIYAAAAVVVVVGAVVGVVAWWCGWPTVALLLAAAAAVTTALSAGALWGSHLAYDRSDLYSWRWLDGWLDGAAQTIVHVHTGLDESSAALRARFPAATVHVFDASDVDAQPEPSIARARKLVPLDPATIAVGLGPLPVSAGSVDVLLLPMAAHEVRDDDVRARWLRALLPVLSSTGRVIVIEHLRDVPNTIAFHLGVLHFLSRRTWLRTFDAAGLQLVREGRIASSLLAVFVLAPERP